MVSYPFNMYNFYSVIPLLQTLGRRKRTTSSCLIASVMFACPVFANKSYSGVPLHMMYFNSFPLMVASKPFVLRIFIIISIYRIMALIKCNECGNMISDRATKCPKCGCPIGNVGISQEEIIDPEPKKKKDGFGL